MAQVQPLKLAETLGEAGNRFAESVNHTDNYDRGVYQRLLKDCDTLQAADVVGASLHRAFLSSTVGNFDETERWLRNAELNGGRDLARIARLTHLVNHGFATQALALVDLVFGNLCGHALMQEAARVATIGAFGKIVNAVVQSQANGEVLQMTNLYATSLKATEIVGVLGVTDANIAAMIDVAGELLRENKLLWQNSLPDLTLLDATQGGPSLGIEYRVDLPPQQAVQLGWRLSEQLIERGLDRPGVYVDFLGTAIKRHLVA